MEIPNICESGGMVQMPNHPWMLLLRGYKWDRTQHHYVWVLSKGEMVRGPFTGEQMTAQRDFFAEQAAKELVDEHVIRELELNDEMVTQL